MGFRGKIFSIGEMAKINQVSIKTLHYYHEKELLIPEYIDPNNGYRYYTQKQFIQLNIIKGARNAKVSIKELQELFQTQDMDKVVQFIQEKQTSIQEQIHQLEKAKQQFEMIDRKIIASKKVLMGPASKVQFFPERWVITSPVSDINDSFLAFNEIDCFMETNKINSIFEHGFIFHNGKMSAAFEVIEEHFVKKDASRFTLFPAGYFEISVLSEEQLIEFTDLAPSLAFEQYTNLFDQNNSIFQIQRYIGKTLP